MKNRRLQTYVSPVSFPSIPAIAPLAAILGIAGLAAIAGVSTPPLLAEDPTREEVAYESSTDATAEVLTGRAISGHGPVKVRLQDVATGNPDEGAAVARAHIQGEDSGGRQANYTPGWRSEDDPGAVIGSGPEAEPDFSAGPGTGPSAPGDVIRTFEGQTYSAWIPPDPVLAVGPKYIVEALNSGFTIFSKDGDIDRPYTNLETFFAPLYPFLPEPWSGNAFVFDPRAHFSPEHDKFVLFALGRDDNNQRSYFFLAISETDNPTGDWNLYFYWDSFDLDSWIDYSGMVADNFGLYLTGNAFLWSGGYKHSILLSIRPTILTGGSTAGWIYTDLRWNSTGSPLARTLQPAVPKTVPVDDETFFVNTYTASGDVASIWELTGDRGSSPSLVRHTVSVSPYADPGVAALPSGADDLELFSSGTLTAAYSLRKVYFSLNDDGTDRSGFYTGKLDVDTHVEERNITYYSNDDYYGYPAVGLFGSDASPLVAVAVSYSSNDTFPSGAVKVFENFMTDNTGLFQVTGTGAANYHNYDSNNRNRWGDYLGVARDWSCASMWFLTEYASALNVWSTRLKHVEGASGVPAHCRLIFDDGFERGSTVNW
jgi:hypothetical protein